MGFVAGTCDRTGPKTGATEREQDDRMPNKPAQNRQPQPQNRRQARPQQRNQARPQARPKTFPWFFGS
ncbi:hypothetical protein CYJ73_20840 [Gordonia terrae]|uniref:Uncharacterized protein n=1 Tax=Gordonia terrae TaxID=2055 RepID=A0A2I1R3G5_9ACTN|nr:hypothetical protein CYJ73_20840 [Gordonia terrae]